MKSRIILLCLFVFIYQIIFAIPKAAFISPITLCNNVDITFINKSTDTITSSTWYVDGVQKQVSSSASNFIWNFGNNTGLHTVSLFVTDGNKTDSISKKLIVINNPKAIFNVSYHCEDSSITFRASKDININMDKQLKNLKTKSYITIDDEHNLKVIDDTIMDILHMS